MSILATGATGLVGYHLCKKLVSEGYQVIGLVHNRFNPLTNALFKSGNFKAYTGDIREASVPYVAIRRNKIKTVFHTAAHVPYTPNKDLVGVNIRGTLNLLNAAYLNGVEEFIYASSMSVYSSPPSYLPVDEIHPTQPSSVYGMTKLAGELSCSSCDSMKVIILRFAGVYGISSEKNRVINSFIHCALNNQPLTVLGDGTQSSDFIDVDDVVQGAFLAWRKGITGIYNIGSGQETSLMELAKCIVGLTSSKSEIKTTGSAIERPFRFVLDISKAKREFGYNPVSLSNGLRAYLEKLNGS